MDKKENEYERLKISYENIRKVLQIEREKSETKLKSLEHDNMNLSEKLSKKKMESTSLQKNLEELRQIYEVDKKVFRPLYTYLKI